MKKKDGTFRCCVDYRQLNSVTRKDAYPLPRIDTCLDALSSVRWLSSFDLISAYHQVHMNSADADKTAFICHKGMFRFKKMPFGLCNAGATFQRLMDVVMSGLQFHTLLIYFDDIVLFSETPEQHLERLVVLLDRLRSAGLKLKPEKCSVFQKSLSFLGHVISEDGISADPQKTKAVADWPVPRTVKEVRGFLGLASYYRKFVPNFSRIAGPLHALTAKGKKFHWNEECQKAFQELKEALISPPILAMPTDEGEMILDTDASQDSIGAVLSERQQGQERVIAYASRRLDRRESNYCVYRRELLSVVHFLRYFRQYLLARTFTVRTDHAALAWLRKTPDPIGQQARWLEIMEEFNFTVIHRPGVRHGNADALSRRPCSGRGCVCEKVIDEQLSETCVKSAARVNEGATDNDLVVRTINRLRTAKNLVGEVVVPFIGEAADESHESLTSQHQSVASNDRINSFVGDSELTWSLAGLRTEQMADPDISYIMELLQKSENKPEWEDVALSSNSVKAMWNQWCRLAIRNDLLQRRFEAADGNSAA